MPMPLVAAARLARSQGRRPMVSVVEADRWVIETWRESRRGWLPDLAAVEAGPGRVRLVVADPAENALLGDAATRSARAVAAVWDQARHRDTPAEVLGAAARSVCDPQLRPRHRNPLAAAVVVDLDPDTPYMAGAARAADGDLWARSGDDPFEALTTSDMLTVEGRARFTDALARAGMGPQRWAAQDESIDDPSMWNHHSVGLVADPTLKRFGGCDASEVVVTTDGSRLEPALTTPEVVASLGEWLAEGICDVGEDWPHPHPFGDLGVIRARFVG